MPERALTVETVARVAEMSMEVMVSAFWAGSVPVSEDTMRAVRTARKGSSVAPRAKGRCVGGNGASWGRAPTVRPRTRRSAAICGTAPRGNRRNPLLRCVQVPVSQDVGVQVPPPSHNQGILAVEPSRRSPHTRALRGLAPPRCPQWGQPGPRSPGRPWRARRRGGCSATSYLAAGALAGAGPPGPRRRRRAAPWRERVEALSFDRSRSAISLARGQLVAAAADGEADLVDFAVFRPS